ncbi:MAG: Ig-like domain-containing protein [Deltaproteobacteria bacterium]|nr:Ig-like domain-containing protein [Deltaproteobacteria bacterium]
MIITRARWGLPVLSIALAALIAACGGSSSDGGGAAASTATRTLRPVPTNTLHPSGTPTLVPTQTSGNAVTGLLLLQNSVASNRGDALAAPSSDWMSHPDSASFDKVLSFADFTVVGVATKRGVTTADGRFEIQGLAAGHYALSINKVLAGNLAAFLVPFAVGDDGTADVVAEIGLGQVKSISTFTRGGVRLTETIAPNGAHVVTGNGRIVEIGDGSRTLTDPDGDGHFAVDGCTVPLSVCEQGETCPNGTVCQCLASCPSCEDCGSPGVCAPAGRVNPYRCNDNGSCQLPGDICRCVPSCPECDDCRTSVCLPICDAVDIDSISITNGPSQLIVGQQGGFSASARLSDGTVIDVTYLAAWQSANPHVASIDSWGTASALAVGDTIVTASIGDKLSGEWPLEVVARPALRTIHVQNLSCLYPLGAPKTAPGATPIRLPPSPGDILPIPNCTQVVQVGGTIQFSAFGEFDDGYYADITNEVTWQLDPSGIGDVTDGLFTGRAVGTTQLTASLSGVTSDATQLKVVTEPSIVAISIYANNGGFAVVDSRVDANGTRPEPCFDCGYTIPVLRGDQLKFQATAQYDTGAWRDVTGEVAWHTSDDTAATIDAHGVMTAVAAGNAAITATLDEVTSNPVTVHVVNEATLQSLSIYQEGTDRVVAIGDQRFFRATGYYDIGIARDVTMQATWSSSDPLIGSFDVAGVFTAHAAGTVNVLAVLGGLESNAVALEVFATSELNYCDAASVNRSQWSDDFNRVILESDCDHYSQPGVAALRYTVTEIQPHGGVFDPCLDLYVYRGDQRVRTIREEGCGDPFIPAAAPGRDQEALKYQLRAFWDLKDEQGNPVSDGTYQIVGRFYLYYDPVVKLTIRVGTGGSQTDAADLVPIGVYVKAPPPPGGCVEQGGLNSASIDVCIANRGGGAAGGFAVSVSGKQFEVRGLAAGAESCFSLPLPSFGKADVIVDVTNAVPEGNEENNQASFFVPILTPPPTCSPSSGTPTPTPSPRPHPHGSIPPPRSTPTPTPTVSCCATGDTCIPEQPPCAVSCCPPNAPCASDTPPCPRCGGLAGLACPAGSMCVDDPTDNCDPAVGADCQGVCVPEKPKQCTKDADCPALGVPCFLCADGSTACPRSFCADGVCNATFNQCPPPGSGMGAAIAVEPSSLTVSCSGEFTITIKSSGTADSTLVIAALKLDNGYSQGEYGSGFSWDTSAISLPLKLPSGTSVRIPVTYHEQGWPQSRLELAIDSNAVNTPHVFLAYHGTSCGTPTATADIPFPICTPPLCLPGQVLVVGGVGGCNTTCATPTPTPAP